MRQSVDSIKSNLAHLRTTGRTPQEYWHRELRSAAYNGTVHGRTPGGLKA